MLETSLDNLRIIKAEYGHMRQLAEVMRDEDKKECQLLGMTPYKSLWRSFNSSFICKSVFVGDDIAAMYGVSGIMLGEKAKPWLLTGHIVDKYPFTFARVFRKEIEKLLHMFQVLENYVDANNTKSVRMIELIGFKLDEPEPMGKGMFRRMEMRA